MYTGHCHAGTHSDVIPADLAEEYKIRYTNNEHFNLWDQHFFPMSYVSILFLLFYLVYIMLCHVLCDVHLYILRILFFLQSVCKC